MEKSLKDKAADQTRRLRLANKIVGGVAIAVYLTMVILAISEGGWFALVPLTSLLLGVGLIYLFIEAVASHLDLVRER